MDVICVGEMVIDFIPGSEPNSYIRNAGGAPANVAIAIARNGLKSGFYGKMGNDDFGRFLVATLKENNVKVLCEDLTNDAITTMAFVTLDENGDRSFTFVRKPGADMLLSPYDIKKEDIENCRIINAGSCSLSATPSDKATIHALRLANSLGVIVAFDVNYRNLLWDNNRDLAITKILEILPYVDLLKVSEEEIQMLGGEDQVFRVMDKFNVSLVVETLGPKGAKSFYQGKVLYKPGLEGKAVDTTGAGDAFWGAFLSNLVLNNIRRLNQLTESLVLSSMEYGNVAGTLCVKKKGAISSLPTRKQIEEYLAAGGQE